MSFKSIFEQANTLPPPSPLVENREKRPLTSILNQELTLQNCDVAEGKNGCYVVMHFEEYPHHYINGGGVILDKLTKTATELGGWDAMLKVIQEERVRVRFESKQSKERNADGTPKYYTDMEVL